MRSMIWPVIGVAFGLALMLFAGRPAEALQVLDMRDGMSKYVNASATDMNVIIFPESVKVYTKGDGLQVQNEDRRVFVLFKSGAGSGPEEIFFALGDETYSMILIPKQVPAETVVVRLADASRDKAGSWERSSDYVSTIKNVMRAICAETPPPGYELAMVKEGQTADIEIGRITLIARYQGSFLEGLRYRLENLGDKAVGLQESEFHRKGVLAVSIDTHTLAPGAVTDIYVVKTSGSSGYETSATSAMIKRPLQ